MNSKPIHITELFKQYAVLRQNLLSRTDATQTPAENRMLKYLLDRYHLDADVFVLSRALSDPYFPISMLEQTIFADVVGMRFFINKKRWDIEPVLARELVDFASVFLRIRHDTQILFDPVTITCIPLDGSRHHLPLGQWCNLCGVCCQIGGLPPDPLAEILYPNHWFGFLSGEALKNQQLCPFLFQYFGEPLFFCAIHNIKPITCRAFDKKDCRRRLENRGLHGK